MKLERSALRLISGALVVAVFLTGAAWYLLRGSATAAEEGGENLMDIEGISTVADDPSLGSQPVLGALVRVDTLFLQVVAAGTAEASRESRLAARSSGVIERVHVREGQRVSQGDVLVQLDTVQAAVNLSRARATLAQAEAQYRERMLGGQGILSASEEAARERIVRAETGLASAELDVAEREMQLEFTRVRAPFAGRVSDLNVVAGGYIGTGGEVLTLVQIDPIHVRLEVLEGEIGRVAPGRRASLRFNTLGGETRGAIVESVNPLVDPVTRAARVTLSLPNPDGRILPGSHAWATLDAQALPDRVLIPRSAVLARGDRQQDVVFILEESGGDARGVAEMRPVTLGMRNDSEVEIVPGDDTVMLRAGEIVLIDGHHFLAVGTRVHLTQPIAGAERGAP